MKRVPSHEEFEEVSKQALIKMFNRLIKQYRAGLKQVQREMAKKYKEPREEDREKYDEIAMKALTAMKHEFVHRFLDTPEGFRGRLGLSLN
jgi:hypothetical protein